MLDDVTWAKLAQRGEQLCGRCFPLRPHERRVVVRLENLLPCEFNLSFGRPYTHSWFDLIAMQGDETPEFRAAWLETALADVPEDERARLRKKGLEIVNREMSDWTPKHEHDELLVPELFRLWRAGMIPKPNWRRLNRLIARFDREPTLENGTKLLDVMAIMAGRPRTRR